MLVRLDWFWCIFYIYYTLSFSLKVLKIFSLENVLKQYLCFMASSNSMTKLKDLYQDLVIFLVPHGQPASGHRDQNPLCLLLCGGTQKAQCCKTSHLHCSMCRKLNRRLINNG